MNVQAFYDLVAGRRDVWSATRRGVPRAGVAGALLVLGSKGTDYSTAEGVPVVFSAQDDFATWAPSECPLCASAIALERPAAVG